MNILITGCKGQLGNEIRLLEKNYPQHEFFNTDVDELDITIGLTLSTHVENLCQSFLVSSTTSIWTCSRG